MPRNYITLLLASVISLTLAINQITKTAAKQLDIASFSIDSAKVTLNEPVLINFIVRNTQSEPIKFDLGMERKESFRVTLTLPDRTRTEPRQQVISGFAQGGGITVPPGEIFTQQVLINEWYEFPVPGVYTVKIEMTTPILSQSGQVIAGNASSTLGIQVLPRDPKALEEICKNLLDQVITSKSYTQAAERATILSFIKDPVAVPYLERMAKGGRRLEQKAVKGLARINNLEAIEVLINLLAFQDPYIAAAAGSSLSKIQLETKDQAIKERIDRALKSR